MSHMSDTEKQFQAALRDVEYKFKREVESEVMSDSDLVEEAQAFLRHHERAKKLTADPDYGDMLEMSDSVADLLARLLSALTTKQDGVVISRGLATDLLNSFQYRPHEPPSRPRHVMVEDLEAALQGGDE